MATAYTTYIEPKLEPLDYGFLGGLAKYGQERQDKQLENTYKLQELIGNLQTASFDRPHKAEIDKEYSDMLMPVLGKVSSGDPTAQSDLTKIYYKMYNDPRFPILKANKEAEDQQAKDWEKLKADKKDIFFNDEKAKFLAQKAANNGKLMPWDYRGSNAFEDPSKDAERLVSHIPVETLVAPGETPDWNTGVIIKNGAVTGFIDDRYQRDRQGKFLMKDGKPVRNPGSRLQNILDSTVPLFDVSPGGRSYHDYLTSGYGISDPNILHQAKEDFIYDALAKYLHKTSGGFGYGFVPEGYMKKEKQPEPPTHGLVESIPVPVHDKELEVDVPGIFSKGLGWLKKEIALTLPATPLTKSWVNPPQWKHEFNDEQKTILNKAVMLYNDNIPQNDTEKGIMINKWLEDHDKMMTNAGILYPSIDDKDWTKNQNQLEFGTDVHGGIRAANRNFKKIPGSKGADVSNGKELLDHYGNKENYDINVTAELNDKDANGNVIAYNQFFPAGKIVTVTNKNDGNVVAQYAMKGDEKSVADNQFNFDIYQSTLKASGVHKFMHNGMQYTADSEYILDPRIKDANGNNSIVGHRITLTDSKGQKEVGEGNSAIEAVNNLYNKIRMNYEVTKKK